MPSKLQTKLWENIKIPERSNSNSLFVAKTLRFSISSYFFSLGVGLRGGVCVWGGRVFVVGFNCFSTKSVSK